MAFTIKSTLGNLGEALAAGCKAAASRFADWITGRKAPEPMSVNVGIINNPRVAQYAAYLEYGWIQKVTGRQAAWFKAKLGENAPKKGAILILPPRPIFGATKREHANKWLNLVRASITSAHGRLDDERILARVGAVAAQDIKDTIAHNGTQSEKFANRSSLTLALLAESASGHKTDATGGSSRAQALVRTGALIGSIGYRIEKGVPSGKSPQGIINIPGTR